MPLTCDIQPVERLRCLWTGGTSTGKTRGLGSWPGKIYIADCDGRIRTIWKDFPNRRDIEYDTFGPYDYEKYAAKLMKIEERPWEYATVVVDSLGSICEMALNYSLETRTRRKNKVGIVSMYDISDFGVESRIIGDTIGILRTIPCHVILTAHIYTVNGKRFVKDDAGNLSEVEFSEKHVVTGAQKLAAKIPGFFDEVWHFDFDAMVVGQPKFFINTIPVGDTVARTCLPLPSRFEWTGKNLWNHVNELVKSKTDIKGNPILLKEGPDPEPPPKPMIVIGGGK